MKLARCAREDRSELLAQTADHETMRNGLGARFRAEVEVAAKLAATFPRHGKAGHGGTRRRKVAGVPFKLLYTEIADGMLIHAVAGDHQFPEYWLGRVPMTDG